MSTREITGHLRELYGIDVSPDLISTVTDAVLEEVAAWQQRPLDPLRVSRCPPDIVDAQYPLVFFDAIRVKIRDEGLVRNKAIHIALGARADGRNGPSTASCRGHDKPRAGWAFGSSKMRVRSFGCAS